MKAIKDAVNFMTAYIDGLNTNDLLSLEIYATTARHEVDLTFNYAAIANRMNELQPGHYDTNTNVGGGLARGIAELTGERARQQSRKVIILLTDGLANINAAGQWDYEGAITHALQQAEIAAAHGIRVFAVSVGSAADQALMAQIAEIGHGRHLHAGGSVEQYSSDLIDIFQELGSERTVQLIQ